MNSSNLPMIQKLKNYGNSGLRKPIKGKDISELLGSYRSLLDFIPNIESPAISDPLSEEKQPLSHSLLRKFVDNFDLNQFGISNRSRVAILLPNGSELAVCLLCVISKYCAAPINLTNTSDEIKSELLSTKSIAIIIQAGSQTNESAIAAAKALGLIILVTTPDPSVSGLFRISPLFSFTSNTVTIQSNRTNELSKTDVVMLLHTSGTSGNKKLVPYSLEMIIVGVGSIISSWNLTTSDCCLQMMPLFHIGGICRNVLSPILAGGHVICCRGFDPILFWDILFSNQQQFTWYYASPTMHHAILQEAERRVSATLPLPVDSIRFIANAAGGLLPVLGNNYLCM